MSYSLNGNYEIETFTDSIPQPVVEGSNSVRALQAQLQQLLLTAAHAGEQDWQTLLSANKSSWERNSLRNLRGWTSERKQ